MADTTVLYRGDWFSSMGTLGKLRAEKNGQKRQMEVFFPVLLTLKFFQSKPALFPQKRTCIRKPVEKESESKLKFVLLNC